MAYLVFNVHSFKIVGAYQTRAAARAAAANNSEITFTPDSFDLPSTFTSAGQNLWYYYDGKIQPDARETTQDRLRNAARDSYYRLLDLSRLIERDAFAHQIETLNKGRNFIAGGLQALYIVLHRRGYTDSSGSSQNYMINHKIRFCNAFPAPRDRTVTARSFLSDVSDSDLPAGPVTWVDPRTATSVTFSQSIALSGTSPSDGTAYNLNLLASEIPDTVNIADGRWIEDLTIMLWGPPTNFATTGRTSNTISLEWDAPTDMGDEPLIGYVLQFKQSSAPDTEWESRSVSALNLEGIFGVRMSSTQYDFRMASLSDSGQGPWTPVLQVSTTA